MAFRSIETKPQSADLLVLFPNFASKPATNGIIQTYTCITFSIEHLKASIYKNIV